MGYLEKQLHVQRKRIQNNKKSEDHIESYKSLGTGSKSTEWNGLQDVTINFIAVKLEIQEKI